MDNITGRLTQTNAWVITEQDWEYNDNNYDVAGPIRVKDIYYDEEQAKDDVARINMADCIEKIRDSSSGTALKHLGLYAVYSDWNGYEGEEPVDVILSMGKRKECIQRFKNNSWADNAGDIHLGPLTDDERFEFFRRTGVGRFVLHNVRVHR